MIDWLPWLFLGAMAIFAMGWMVARVDIKQLLVESRALPRAYFKGLNFLLNEQQDRAIESFMEVTKANPEAVELQFALGSLFRRRGEVDRAIRVHQELSERTSLTPEQRANALIELAMDYQKAGLLEHAERILADAIANRIGSVQQQLLAMKNLQDIYVQERAWRKAIDIAAQFARSGASAAHAESGPDASQDAVADRNRIAIANYHCELALQAKQEKNEAVVDQHLSDALVVNPKCVRANLIRAELLADAGRYREAIAQWREIEQQDAAFLGLNVFGIVSCFD
jgi:lipopolysaccharide biosynthesis regulator YciM